MNRKKKILLGAGIVVIALIVGGGIYLENTWISDNYLAGSETADDSSEGEVKQSDNEKNVMSEEQQEIFETVKATYDSEAQMVIAESLEEEKQSGSFTPDNMLIEYNPFGTNTQSLYIYFVSDTPVSVAYTIHVDDEDIDDFTKTVDQSSAILITSVEEEKSDAADVSEVSVGETETVETIDTNESEFTTEHEFQLIGLIPDMTNKITFMLTAEDGSTSTYETSYDMGDIYGEEEIQLSKETFQEDATLENGLYVILGNDSTSMDFMYYYDNNGILRGEVPILGYRSHRLLFDDTSMYYSISEKKIAQVSALGQVTNVYELGDYKLHHDYVFDDAGNMLILATDTTQDSIEDIVLSLDLATGECEEVLDLGDLMADYKSECVENSSDELDWAHINTIQYMGEDAILLSSRETSSILKIENISEDPTISYIISDQDVWNDTSYEDLVLDKVGDFTIQGGQHTITYETDDDLENGQYYLYMFNNNIGVSETRPDYDWSALGLTNTSGVEGDCSYYYKYLVDETAGTFELIDSFEVPYSGYVSSVQEIGDHVIVDSGLQGTFTEYDSNHEAIATFTMEKEKFIYRVFKYEL